MYGSFANRVMESSRQPKAEPGMGGTVCYWSDRSSVTVVAVRYAKSDGITYGDVRVGDEIRFTGLSTREGAEFSLVTEVVDAPLYNGADQVSITVGATTITAHKSHACERRGKVTEIDTVGDTVGPNKALWPAQDYDITPGWTVGQEIPARVQTWRVDSKGRLRSTYVNENGRRVLSARNGGPGLSLGHRDEYRDPHM